jgi:hypothetical protein
MKKIATMVLMISFLVVPQAGRAATLSQVMSKLEALQVEIAELRAQILGQVTGSVPPGGFATPLKRGSTGPEVVALQNFLSEKGFYTGLVDGSFGLGTLNALNAYKASIGFSSWGSSFGGTWRVTGDPILSYTVTTNACKADFDGNGKIQVADYVLLQENLTLSPEDNQIMFDVKIDGVVDKYDIREWMTQYGKTNFCMTSSTTSQWTTIIAGTTTSAPAPSAVPAGSSWTSVRR